MKEQLKNKLYNYLIENNPDLLLQLQEEKTVDSYLEEKIASIEKMLWQLQEDDAPAYVIEEICMDSLTENLRPSRFNFICSILQTDYLEEYQHLQETGTLTYEVVNLIAACKPVLEAENFSEASTEDPATRSAAAALIQSYLTNHS